MKIRRQDSGDDILPPVEHHRSSDNRRIGVEPTFEERVWENDTILAHRRRPAESKARTREIPESIRNRGDARLHHLVTDVDGLGGGQESSHAVKNSGLIAPRVKIGRHDDVVLTAVVKRGDPYQALRMRIGQRSHEHGVDDAEHGRVQPDPKGKGEHDDD